MICLTCAKTVSTWVNRVTQFVSDFKKVCVCVLLNLTIKGCYRLAISSLICLLHINNLFYRFKL